MFGRKTKQPAKAKRKVPIKLRGQVSAEMLGFTLAYNFDKPVKKTAKRKSAQKRLTTKKK